MKFILAFLLTFFFYANAWAIKAVPYVDLDRYLGTWYEIAKYPNDFQRGCVFSKATYSVWEPGVIRAENKCIESDGKITQAIGKAYIVDSTANSKLKIQFFLKSLNIAWLQGDYWIIKLDEDYQYVVVSEPSQQYLWILARTPEMDEATYAQLLTWLDNQGFDLDKIVKDPFSIDLNPGFFASH